MLQKPFRRAGPCRIVPAMAIDPGAPGDEFLRSLSHDLRNYLAAVRNAVELLRRDPGSPATLDFACGIIDKQLHEMERLAELADERRSQASEDKRSVLLADDDRDSVDSLAALLRLEGYTVHTAYGGREAVDTAVAERPDIMIVDIGMPKMSGYDVARHFRTLRKEERPILIALTAWGQESDKLLSKQAGFDLHLTKPVEPAHLAKLLKTL
jgi:CheY-like chemotaxis protein